MQKDNYPPGLEDDILAPYNAEDEDGELDEEFEDLKDEEILEYFEGEF